jgi:serine/threonine protein kinase
MMKIRNDELRRLSSIAEGGEGIIYEYNGNILKVYKNSVDLATKERKITSSAWRMLPKEVVAPTEAVYNSNGKFIGFLMPKVIGEEIRVLTNRKFLKSNGIGTDFILKILVKIQQTVRELHKHNIYIGDLNDQNILFDIAGNVYFIDCDSWSIEDVKCEVVMDLYRDPMMNGNDFSESTDMYAMSILIWKTLTRIHPHGGTMEPDMDILDRMKKGISVIDNPKVKIPRTIKSWNNLSPNLVSSLKAVFENRSRSLGNELDDMLANLKYCDKDKEYYYGKFNKCPLCDGSASVITKPVSQGVMGGLTIVAMLNCDDVKIVLNEHCYLNMDNEIVNVQSQDKLAFLPGMYYHFLNIWAGLLVLAETDNFSFTTDRIYQIAKKHKSPIYVDGDDVYYITPANTFTKMTITKNGNGVNAIAKCSNDTYFAADGEHYCLVNRYDGKLIVNCDGRNIEIPYTDKVIDYGIHRDNVSGNWLVVLENGSGIFRTFIIGSKVEYETDQIKYVCGLGNLCLSNNTIYIPIDGKIRGYSWKKQVFKDFECGTVTPDSHLIKNGPAFTIVNDENIYRLGR